MPRKGPAPKRLARRRPGLRQPARHAARQQDPPRRQEVDRRDDRLRRPRGLPPEDRHRPRRHAQARARQRQAGHGGQEPSRRWRDLPGADRGQAQPLDHARSALARRLLAAASREDDDRAPHERDSSTRATASVPRSSVARTRTRWPSPTRPSRTTAGDPAVGRCAGEPAPRHTDRTRARRHSTRPRRPRFSLHDDETRNLTWHSTS